MKIITIILLITFLFPAQFANGANEIRGTVVSIHDGDTVTILTPDKQQLKVRLTEIDAPELDQPFGMSSKKLLSKLIYKTSVVISSKGNDRYGRTLGRITLDNEDINLKMIKLGGAWAYRKYVTEDIFLLEEQKAMNAKVGLWALQADQTFPPWEWRKSKRK